MRYAISRYDNPEVFFGYYSSLKIALLYQEKIEKREKKPYRLLSEAEHKNLLREREIDAAQSPWVVYNALNELPTCIVGISAFEAFKMWSRRCQFVYHISQCGTYLHADVYAEKDEDKIDPIFSVKLRKASYPDELLLNVAAVKIFRQASEFLPLAYRFRACTLEKYRAILHAVGLEESNEEKR